MRKYLEYKKISRYGYQVLVRFFGTEEELKKESERLENQKWDGDILLTDEDDKDS